MRCVSRLPPLGQHAARAWPRIHPGLSRRLCLVIPAGKGTRAYLARSLPNRNRARVVLLACQTEIRGLRPGFLVLSYMLRAAGEGLSEALRVAGTPGKSRMAVSPPP